MKNPAWLVGPLLWEVALYWQSYVDEKKAGLFSEVYPNIPELDLFTQAVEHKDDNHASEIMKEATALALGIPKTEMPAQKQGRALASVLSNVRLKQDDSIPSIYLELPDWSENDPFQLKLNDESTLNSTRLKEHIYRFVNELKHLRAIESHLKVEVLLSIIEQYFCYLPPFNPASHNDIPIFACSKMASAIASCWPQSDRQLPDIPDRNTVAYTLMQGDLSGIQNYIYRISSAKGAAKGLKSRSFELSLISDIVARYLLTTSELTGANILYSSGGKFYIIAPAEMYSRVEEWHGYFEEKFYNRFKGDVYLGLGAIQLTGNDLSNANFPAKWQEVNAACNSTKQHKFGSIITQDFDRIFKPKGIGQEQATCDSCGVEESGESRLIPIYEENILERQICEQCQKMEEFARVLSRAEFLIEVVNEAEVLESKNAVRLEPLQLKPRLTYYVVSQRQIPAVEGDTVTYYALNQPFDSKDTSYIELLKPSEAQFGSRSYGGKDFPLKDQQPAEYDELANRSDGLKRLGVLRMDVDNLGQVFRYGLGQYEGEALQQLSAPPARIITLSWYMNHFFSYQLNRIQAESLRSCLLLSPISFLPNRKLVP